MDLKKQIDERIAAAAEGRRKAKLEEARLREIRVNEAEQAQEELLAEQEKEEIERQIRAEINGAPPPSLSGLRTKKRRRPEHKNNASDNQPTDPQRSPKKSKHSFNDIESTQPKAESKPERFAPPPRAPRSKTNGVWREREIVNTRKDPSEWYLNTNVNQKFNRGDLQTIAYIKTLISNCTDAVKNGGDTERHFTELRERLHEMEFYPFLSGVLVKKSKVLESDGLLQIFDEANKSIFPWDLAADAEALWLRWMSGELDADLMRGIQISKGVLESGKKRTSYKLKRDCTRNNSANAVGTNNLTNGQWWPSRICALRDGAHGEQEAGIHGQTGKGAYSVVVAVGGYADKDHGETIEYCGTASETSTPTKSTSLMLDAWIKNQPVRVLRAVNKNSKYAPKEGIRYDGLYNITDKEILDPKTAISRFSLKRIKGQDPIRYKGVESRPTDQELKERMTIRKLLE